MSKNTSQDPYYLVKDDIQGQVRMIEGSLSHEGAALVQETREYPVVPSGASAAS
jgi:hypothetical protein